MVVLLAVVAHGVTPTLLEFCPSGSEADQDFTPLGWHVFLELPELPVATLVANVKHYPCRPSL